MENQAVLSQKEPCVEYQVRFHHDTFNAEERGYSERNKKNGNIHTSIEETEIAKSTEKRRKTWVLQDNGQDTEKKEKCIFALLFLQNNRQTNEIRINIWNFLPLDLAEDLSFCWMF